MTITMGVSITANTVGKLENNLMALHRYFERKGEPDQGSKVRLLGLEVL